MIRNILVAAAAGALLVSAGPALAQDGGAYYTATPVAAPAHDSLIIRSTVWHCGGGVCMAPRGDARDAIVCQLAAEALGKLGGFSAKGVTFDPAALEKCNAHAK